MPQEGDGHIIPAAIHNLFFHGLVYGPVIWVLNTSLGSWYYSSTFKRLRVHWQRFWGKLTTRWLGKKELQAITLSWIQSVWGFWRPYHGEPRITNVLWSEITKKGRMITQDDKGYWDCPLGYGYHVGNDAMQSIHDGWWKRLQCTDNLNSKSYTSLTPKVGTWVDKSSKKENNIPPHSESGNWTWSSDVGFWLVLVSLLWMVGSLPIWYP